ncbi:hypothetical protein ES708_26697 [subsurface metagenome]
MKCAFYGLSEFEIIIIGSMELDATQKKLNGHQNYSILKKGHDTIEL